MESARWRSRCLSYKAMANGFRQSVAKCHQVFKGTTAQATGVAEAPTQDLEDVSGVISTSKKVLTWVLEAMTGVVSAEGKNLEEGI